MSQALCGYFTSISQLEPHGSPLTRSCSLHSTGKENPGQDWDLSLGVLDPDPCYGCCSSLSLPIVRRAVMKGWPVGKASGARVSFSRKLWLRLSSIFSDKDVPCILFVYLSFECAFQRTPLRKSGFLQALSDMDG